MVHLSVVSQCITSAYVRARAAQTRRRPFPLVVASPSRAATQRNANVNQSGRSVRPTRRDRSEVASQSPALRNEPPLPSARRAGRMRFGLRRERRQADARRGALAAGARQTRLEAALIITDLLQRAPSFRPMHRASCCCLRRRGALSPGARAACWHQRQRSRCRFEKWSAC